MAQDRRGADVELKPRPPERSRFGPLLLGPGKTLFRLWAPALSEARLEIRGGPDLEMSARPDGWFETVAPCGPGARYRFRLTDALAVPDPAARAMDGDVHGWSVVVDPDAYAWTQTSWTGRPFEETVLYEAHAGLLGGFEGLTARVPELAELGVTALELMPIADFPGTRNWGYDGVLPFAPDAAYGSPEALKALVDAAHRSGLMIFLDVVYNHFGPDGNYLPVYAPQTFRQDKATAWGGALDMKVEDVARFFIDNAVFWLTEYRFDGLRFDAVHAIADPSFLERLAEETRRRVGPERRVHLVLENDDNQASLLARGFDAQWNDDFHHVLHVLLTDETSGYYKDYAERPVEKLARALSEGFVYQGEPSQLRAGEPRGEASGGLRATAFVNFLQNHDQIGNRAFGERLTTLADPRALEAAVVLLLLSPAVPMIFMGEEDGAEAPFLYFTDHNPELAEAVREGRRNEFKGFSAFADETARKRIPDPNAVSTFERSRPDRPRPDRRRLYRELLEIRRQAIVPRLVGARSLAARPLADKAVMAEWRLGDGRRLTIAANFSPRAAPFEAPRGERLFELRPGEAGLGPFCALAVLGPAL